uniref:adenosine receptor A1-like n=1 Tax=Myxine glutinosa TaxID=7769 RepID=UPI00358F98F2
MLHDYLHKKLHPLDIGIALKRFPFFSAYVKCESVSPYPHEMTLNVPYTIAEVVISVLSVVGNGLVCVAVMRTRHLRTVTNYFIVSLAVADICVGVVVIPSAILEDFGLPRHNFHLCVLMLSSIVVFTESSVLSLLAVAVERYLAIFRPLRYQVFILFYFCTVVSDCTYKGPLKTRYRRHHDQIINSCCKFLVKHPISWLMEILGPKNFPQTTAQERGNNCGRTRSIVSVTKKIKSFPARCCGRYLCIEKEEFSVSFRVLSEHLMMYASAMGACGLPASSPCCVQELMTHRNALITILIVWIFSIVIGLVPTMGWHLPPPDNGDCFFVDVVDMSYNVNFIFFGCFLPPLLFMFFIYTHIFFAVRRQLRRIATEGTSKTKEHRAQDLTKKEVKTATSLFLVLFLFCLCWLPLHIINVIFLHCSSCHVPFALVSASIILSHINSAVNPIFYSLRMRSFRRAFLNIILCRGGVAEVM